MPDFRSINTDITPYAVALTDALGEFVDDLCLPLYMLSLDDADWPLTLDDVYNEADAATLLEDRLILEIGGALPSEVWA